MFEASPSWSVGAALLVAALAGAPLAAQAQIYKCTQANGSVGYQATPCPASAKSSSHPTASQLNAEQAAKPKDDKPYDDPYANSLNSRPHPPMPAVQAPPSPFAPPPFQATQGTSSLVADVQARNKRENQQQAYQEAHKNDRSAASVAACNSAKHNLGVLNEQRPVYSYDKQGNRVYVEDKDRASTIAETQRAVNANCQ